MKHLVNQKNVRCLIILSDQHSQQIHFKIDLPIRLEEAAHKKTALNMAETVWMAVHFLLQRFSDVGYSVTLLSVVMQSLTTCPQQFM